LCRQAMGKVVFQGEAFTADRPFSTMKYSILLSLLIVACSAQVSAPSKPAPTTPTTPVAQPGPLAEWLNVSSPVIGSGTSAQSVAYVSLPSGHVNATDSVFLTNRRT